MQRTDLSVSPFFDDFNEDKNFHRILFRPRPVQARELNQMQTILSSQIERLGKHIFSEGSMVIPGGIKTITSQNYITLTLSGGGQFTDLTSQTQDLYVLSNTSGLMARISKMMNVSGADPITFFIDYTNSGSSQEKMFTSNEGCSVVTINSDGSTNHITNITVQSTGQGQWVKVQAGVYFIRGMFVKTTDQDVVVSKYTTDSTMNVGFLVSEQIVSETDDSTLYSNAIGYPNFNAAGASRLKITLTLSTLSPTANNQDFITIASFENGSVTNRVDYTDYSLINDAIAKRTYETNGNFTVNPFGIDIREHLNNGSNGGVYTAANGGDSTKMVAILKPGIAYVLGYRSENVGLQYINIDKARDTTLLHNSVTSIDYGQYVLANTLSSIPDIDIKKKYILKDSGNNQIGTASIRAVKLDSGTTYRLYLFNIVWTGNNTINNLSKITYSDSSNNFSCSIYGSPVLYDSNSNSLLFKLPVDAVKSLLNNGVSNTSYTVMRSYNTSTNSSGVATISCGTNESFGPINLNEYIVADTGATNGGVIYNPNTISLSGTPVGSSITVNLGVPNANKSIKVVCPIFKQAPVQKTKTLTQVTSEAITFTNVSKMNLANADIQSLVSVLDATTNEDITGLFTYDNGQRANFYAVGSISTISGQNITRNVKVSYTYFQHSTGDYFTADSYGGLARESIPTFTIGSNTYNLADCTDFRPLQDSTGSFTSSTVFGEIAKPASTFLADIVYYLPRKDIIYVDSTGSFGDVKGTPSISPQVPPTPDNAMKLYELTIPPYTSDINAVGIKFIENKRYTMRDIGKLETRISNLEYYTTLSSVENVVNKTQVIDPTTGNNRFKNGFAVDGFNDFSLGDTTSSDWKASMDISNGLLKPQFVENGLDYTIANTTPTNANTPVAAWMMGYTTTPVVVQPYATRTSNINPYAVFTWIGKINLNPSTDFWKDVKYNAPIIINNTINLRGNAVQGTVWNSWTSSSWNTITTTTTATTTTFTSSFSSSSTNNLVSTTVIPYQRSIPVRVGLSGFKPYTRLYPFWDGVAVDAYCQQDSKNLGDPIITDASGSASVTYTIPNTTTVKFKTGTTVMRWTDRQDDSRDPNLLSTWGEQTFTSGGSLDTRQVTTTNTTILNYVQSTSTARSVSVINRIRDDGGHDRGASHDDPIAQTFLIPTSGGCFVPKIDIFFATKAVNVPVFLELRTVYTGLPTSDVIATAKLYPSQITTSTDSSVASSFVFDDPVYLIDTQEYAMVLKADTQEYNVYIAQLGENVIGANMALSKQPNLGVFLTSSNSSTWTPNQTQDLKFTIHRCVFNTSSTTQLAMNGSSPIGLPVAFNAIQTTNGSNQLVVNMPSHGLQAGDHVTISGATAGNNLLTTDVNGTFTVTASTIDTFTFVNATATNANVTGYIGGSSILVTANYSYTTFMHTADTFIPNGSSVLWEYQTKAQSGRAPSGWITFDPKSNVILKSEGVVLTSGDFQVRATLSTTVDNLSPCIGVAGQNTILVSTRVNNDFSNPVYSYVTSPIIFNNPSTSATFYVGALLPNGSNMKLYYKAIDNQDQDLSKVSWTEITPTTPIRNDMSNYLEYEYDLSGIGSFIGYVIKIVMVTSDNVNYPILSDFRSIALA